MNETKPATTISQQVLADYLHIYGGRSESRAVQTLKGIRRFAIDPSLHAVVLIRLVLSGPAALSPAICWLLRVKHDIEVSRDCEVGPGLVLAHPFSIVLAPGTRIGANVKIYHNVRLGTPSGPGPQIGDDAAVYCNSTIDAGVHIGAGALVGANCEVRVDVPDGRLFARGQLQPPR